MNDAPQTRNLPVRILLGIADVIITAFVLADAAARPIYRPLYEAVARLALIRRMETLVARMPRSVILVVLAVPFFGVEPLKILGLIWIGEGRLAAGLGMLVFAYATGFILVERVYHAGRDKLLTIEWFATCIRFASRIKDRVLDQVRATAAWRVAMETARGARAFAKRLVSRPATRT